MLGVMIVPTGVGAQIGGHAGDAAPAAKLIASCCDKLIVHPNVVNGSDLNEMTENMLYVEGSILDRFLQGRIQLKERKMNTILVVVNPPLSKITINAVNAARVTVGIDASILELRTPLRMIAKMDGLKAGGEVIGWRELVEDVSRFDFDALAIHTSIEVSAKVQRYYFENGGVNPWGGVEAKASKLIARELKKPVAHAPVGDDDEQDILDLYKTKVVDPRMAPEIVSNAFFHCVLKGLHRAPILGKGISCEEVDFMVSPWGVRGTPHVACEYAEIPIIYVEENKTVFNEEHMSVGIAVKNYLEAAGVVSAMNAGVSLQSVRRPIASCPIKEVSNAIANAKKR